MSPAPRGRGLDFLSGSADNKGEPPNRLGGWVRGRRKAASAYFLGTTLRTNFYVDGFNLYYGDAVWVQLAAPITWPLPAPAVDDPCSAV